jgi:hypothetical protein
MTMIRTAMGKLIDMDAIAKQNEDTVAVGNVPMNARGDRLDETGRVRVPASTVSRVQRDLVQPTETIALTETEEIEKSVEKQKANRKKKVEPKVVSERTRYGLNGEEIIEVEYEDGSIEVKNDK